jgi:hypothetical protein
VDGGTAVRLWHPVRAPLDEIRARRDLLIARQVRQPFKQAFREIYLLTPAERETRVYSNRFAAHILTYQRLYALFKARGWTTARMLGPWDGGDEADATREPAGRRWRVRFFHSYVESGLASTDQVRRDALARLLPRTRLSSRVELTDRFLRVHGSLRTYKIHLGSANILMEPDDAYLCIVRSPSGADRVFLPFADERLALILSKAFLLADDAAIDDETILRQIKRGP